MNRTRRVVIPLRAENIQGAYRIGIAIEAREGPGESVPAAFFSRIDEPTALRIPDGQLDVAYFRTLLPAAQG